MGVLGIWYYRNFYHFLFVNASKSSMIYFNSSSERSLDLWIFRVLESKIISVTCKAKSKENVDLFREKE